MARIDAPLLNKLSIAFLHQLILDIPQLSQFISRTPKFKAYDEALVIFESWGVHVTVPRAFGGALRLAISCRESDWQLSSLAQVCGSSFLQALIPMVEQPMAGISTSIYLCEGPLYILGCHAKYRYCLARACQGKGDRTVTRLQSLPVEPHFGRFESFAVCFRATSCRSPHYCFSLGLIMVV